MAELYANKAASTLDGDIDDSVTTLDVVDASTFPSGGNFRIIIDSEIMIVTAVSSETFTVTRGAESTTAASHSDGQAVTHVLTAASLALVTLSVQQALGTSISQATNQSISNMTSTALIWTTVDRDDLSAANLGSHNTRLTAPTTGWYMFSIHAKGAAGATGTWSISPRINGSTFFANAQFYTPTTGGTTDFATAAPVYLSANDYIEAMVYQNTGGSRNVNPGEMRLVRFG
ncbi:MAG: hypothetical protein ACREMY_16235 [bacterium]